MSEGSLAALGRRVEVLALSPGAIEAPLTRLLRPLLSRVGWRPRLRADAATALVAALRAGDATPGQLAAHVRVASAELERNVSQVERATVLAGRPLVAHASWLRRVYELLVHAGRAVERRQAVAPSTDPAAPYAPSTDPATWLAPLSLAEDPPDEPATDDEPADGPDPGQVIDVELQAVDVILTLAREETRRLGRRRRLLEASRQLLLETSAALPLDPHGVAARVTSVSRGVQRLNRLEAVGVRSDVDLLHQARTSLARGERPRLWATLEAMHELARDGADEKTAALATEALQVMTRDGAPPAASESLLRSAREVFDERVVNEVGAAFEEARAEGACADTSLLLDYLAPGAEAELLAHALAVDGCLEVGGTLCPVRVQEQVARRLEVPYPAPELVLVPARRPSELASALVSDPRRVLLDLAAGRLLHRRHVREQRTTRSTTQMRGELRLYVLDASQSMVGPRARMRDAILVAELATLLRRLERPQPATRVTLRFRFFTHRLGAITRVAAAPEALAAIGRLLRPPRPGGTDIEGALLATLAAVREARDTDPELASAQVVLVTDGEAPVSEARVQAALAEVEDVAVGISVVALGEENPALRQLVARQRRRGVRAFYHHLRDGYLRDLSSGRGADPIRVHVPPVGTTPWDSVQAEIEPLLDELAQLARTRERAALGALRVAQGEGEDERPGEGARARLEARLSDDAAAAMRFARWFPRELEAPAGGASGGLPNDDVASVRVLLAAIVEVLEIVGTSESERHADAVDLLERLLPDARITPARYRQVLREHPEELADALSAVRAVAARGVMWRLARS